MDEIKDQENEENNDIISLQAPIKDFGTIKKVEDDPARLFNIPFPVEVPYQDQYHEYFQGETFKPAFPTGHEQIGAWESLKQGFNAVNDFSLMYNSQTNNDNPLYDVVPPGWKAADDEEVFNGIDDIYKGYLLAATSPKDLKRRQYQVIGWMNDTKRYEDGSMLYHAIGMLGGGAVSPTTWIPLGAEVRAAHLGKRLAQDIPNIVPGIAVGSALHEYVEETNKINGSIEEYITNTFRDTIFGVAFMGGAMGLSHAYNGGKLYNAKRIVNLNGNDIDLKPIIGEDGTIIGIKALSSSAGAAELSFAQEFANSTMAQKGLFGVPVIGGWLGKGAATVNPIIRGLNSVFPSVAAYWDRSADHGIVTKGNIKGIASPDKVEVKLEILKGDNRIFMNWLTGMHLVRNGLDPSQRVRSGFKEAHMRWKDEGYTSPEQFMDEIEDVIINDTPSIHAATNEAAESIKTKYAESWEAYRDAYDLPKEFTLPKTAKGYLSRVYDLDYLSVNENHWNEVVVDYLTKADATIAEKMQPIRDLEANYKLVKEQHNINKGNMTPEERKVSADLVNGMKKQLQGKENALQNELRTNEALRIHVEDHFALSAKEANQLKNILKPLNKLKQEQNSLRNAIKSTNFLKLKEEGVLTKDNVQVLKKIESDLMKLKDELRTLDGKIDQENLRLQQAVEDKKISSLFYTHQQGTNVVKFKNPKERLKLRQEYESEHHRKEASKAYYRSITNQTAEDTINQMMGTLTSGITSNPIKQRSIMLPDDLLYTNKFLSKKLGVNVANYRMYLGRRTFIKNVFKDVSIDGDVAPLARAANEDFLVMKGVLDAKKANTKSKKEILKIDKDIIQLEKLFKRDIEDMSLNFNKLMGVTTGNQKIRKYTNDIRNYAVSTQLGATTLTMITDLMGVVFKHGFWPSIRDGVIPQLKNIANIVKQGKGENYIKNAGHAGLGLNHVLSGMSDRNAGGVAQPYMPVSGRISTGLEKVAHISTNLSLMNHVENAYQELTASIIQSKIISHMINFKAGKLSPKDKEKLLIYGLQPEIWADKIVAAWKKAGSDKNGSGGYQSWYWKWDDKETASKFAETIFRGTKDTIIRRGMFDAPFALDDPILGMLFMFKGFFMASFTRYLIPLMQRPDAEKLVGTLLMMGMGAMVTPLRRLAKGEEPIQEDDNMFWNAMVDGNVFSSVTDTLEYVNVLMGGNLLKDIRNDRYKDRTIAGFLAGPVGGMGDNFVHILKMLSSGNFNQSDVNKVAKLIPWAQIWQLRYLSKKLVESTGLPETYSDAEAMNYQ